jgi:hypothetical protein
MIDARQPAGGSRRTTSRTERLAVIAAMLLLVLAAAIPVAFARAAAPAGPAPSIPVVDARGVTP